MNNSRNAIYDFSNLVANEVEIETSKHKVETNIDKSIPKVEEPFFDLLDYKNGAIYHDMHYCWSQSFNEIEIHARLPENVTTKNLKVNITNTSIDIYIGTGGNRKQILNGQLYDKCKASDSIWTITGGNKLNISFDKIRAVWWMKLFEHEASIDMSKIDCSRPMEELNDETQAQIHQIQYDEQQKQKGELTSEQTKQQELLRKAWDAEGSPFKGHKFDPNILQFGN